MIMNNHRFRYKVWHRLFLGMTILAMLMGSQAVPISIVQAAPNTLTLSVISARTEPRAFGGAGVTQGDPISNFKYIINIDNTGTTEQRSPAPGSGCAATDPGYPANCYWASIMEVPAPSPVYTQGEQSDFPLDIPDDGRYLISVIADGYKIDGAYFSVTNGVISASPLVVELQPNPLPDSTLRAQVFSDTIPTDGTQGPDEPGLAGFVGHITDVLGEVQTDVYGNPLCTVYQGEDPVTHEIPLASLDGDMLPIVAVPGGNCVSDADGLLTMPHLGSNRYALSVTPPDGQTWIQTTTLEGNHDFDAWIMEGSTGYDTEFVVAGEPVPQPIFGFVPPTNNLGGGGGSITGVVVGIKSYTPPKGGSFDFWGGNTGTKVDAPIVSPWLSLADLQAGDVAVWAGQGNPDGSFNISGVPDGNYQLSWWDEPQNYNLNMINVTISGGQAVQMGTLPLNGWWTRYDGYIFNDLNRDGVMDPGEPGIPNFTLTMRRQDNSLMDRGQTTVSTDQTGYYLFESAYPLGAWTVMEAYSDSYYTTGITYQADNQPTPTTVLGAGVDVSVLSIIGLSGRMDWGVHNYDPTGTNGIDPRNGGIVGTVSYGTTRNELDPQFLAAEDWQPGVSDVPIRLWSTVACGTNPDAPCDLDGIYELAPDGSLAKGQLLNTYVTEHWTRPTGCTARDVDGNPLIHGVDENVLAPNQENDGECISSFIQSVQFGPYPTDQGTSDANFGAAVDGNYGFGDGCYNGTLDDTDPANPICNGADFEPLTAGDYLVEAVIPTDVFGKPLYKVTSEEDINIGNGDQIVPQVPPPACAGALHTVDVLDGTTDNYPEVIGDGNSVPLGVTVPASTPVDNVTFLDIGGSPYEGMPKPRCETKLVTLHNGKSIVPIFEVFTDVPIPSRLRGLVVDDINFSKDPRSTMYGEKAGVPFIPIGIYDFNNRLVDTLESDFNGVYDVLLPSTNHISCPTPSGVCANMYRFVANDPGVPGKLNPNYNPRYRTIATEFEALPGLNIPTDLAPTQVGLTIESPATGIQQVACLLDPATPQLFAVSQPYVNGSGSFTINGLGFGNSKGTGQVTLDGTIVLPTTSWNDTTIQVTVPAGTPAGPHQLNIRADNGQNTINGLTFHVLSIGGAGTQTLYFSTDNNNTPPGAGGGGDDADIYRWNSGNSYTRVIDASGGGSLGLPGGANVDGFVRVDDTHFYMSFSDGVTIPIPGPDLSVADDDVVYYNAGTWSLFFDGTANGLPTSSDIDGLTVVDTTHLYMSFNDNVTIPIPGPDLSVADEDIVYFNAGTWSLFFDGTANGLPNSADIDGLTVVDSTHFYISFNGSVTISIPGPDLSVADEDVVYYNAGAWSLYFDGSANGLGSGFDLDAISVIGGAPSSGSYNPNLYEVGPGRSFATIQGALDAAAASSGDDLVVVYPGLPDFANPRGNPRGAYYENIIITTPVKLQGVGPGGFQASTFVPGSIIDGGAFGGDTALATAWYAKVGGLTWGGNQAINDGEVVYILANDGVFTASYKASIDGFDIRGGDQRGFPGNINDLTGAPTGLPPGIVTQGGAIFANAYARNLQITNNIVQNNGGAYGTIRIGTPDLPAPDTNQHNENIRIANNRIISNAGTNLAGGIGIFAGADNYEVARNDICGNFSVEYGGGLSVYGRSPNGQIHHNRIYFNMSNDEGGGIMIAGEIPATLGALSPGSGPVNIYANQIQANLANDDGGGLRFLMAGGSGGVDVMNVYNNMIVNNVSTHEGGGIGLNDTPNVRVYNNTIMKNLTTATALTSNGQPAPAGLSTSGNSDQLQATLPGGSPTFSNPLLFNNIFSDNRAGTRIGNTVTGIGLAGVGDIDSWDVGVANGTPGQLLAPTYSIIQQGVHPYTASPTNSSADPSVVSLWDLAVSFATWRQNPGFVNATLVTLEAPPNLLGNYHLNNCPGSPACNLGASASGSVSAPATDFDDQSRPALGGFDSGADEFGGTPSGPPPSSGTSDLYFSTSGNTNPPGVSGTADDADIYLWNNTAFSRSIDVTAITNPLPNGANVDGFTRIDNAHFYMSFDDNVTISIPGPDLSVADEDVVYYNAGTWSLFFDGSVNGLSGTDLDAISIVGGQLYFSTNNTAVPPGAGGSGDDADIYLWNGGSSYTRMIDASALGWSTDNVDGLVYVDVTHVYLSYSTNTTVPVLGAVQDEDIVFNNGGTWSVYFDGTAHGLTSGDLDVDAFSFAGTP